jgi:hypothetical protein
VRTRFYIELEKEGDASALKSELTKLLLEANLAPAFDPAEIDKRRDELLKEIPDARRETVRKAFVTTLYEPMYASWGFISNVSGRVFEVRMSNPHSFRLQASVARVVSAMRARAGKLKLGLKFKPEVEIFETAEDHAQEQATILEHKLWRFARWEKRVAWRLFWLASVLAIAALVLTMPGPSGMLFRDALGVSPAWLQWWTDTLGRFASAGLVVAATALLDVFLHWRHLQGVAPVIWPLEGQR